jgi:hypothetical protein
MAPERPLHGIISYLTRRHGGNVHDQGIVTITASSMDSNDHGEDYSARNVADLKLESSFNSKNEENQWVCWDFGDSRITVKSYTLKGFELKSWIVEGSMDGENWSLMDRKIDTPVFDHRRVVSSVISKPCPSRFVRVTQIGTRRDGYHYLTLWAVEFFGTLIE